MGKKGGGLYEWFVKIGEMLQKVIYKNSLLWNYHCFTEQAIYIYLVVSHLEFYLRTTF